MRSAWRQHATSFAPTSMPRCAPRRNAQDRLSAGAAELGDFDATSTTIALAPGGEQHKLPQDLLRNTFERYWREFEQRRDGKREWDAYTPYEWRNVGRFVRLGWRERAWEAVQYFFKDRAPEPGTSGRKWFSRTPRQAVLPRRSAACMGRVGLRALRLGHVRLHARSRRQHRAGGGDSARWLDGQGIAIDGLRTPQGKLAYTLRRDGRAPRLDIPAGLRLPAGGLVLPWPIRASQVPPRSTAQQCPGKVPSYAIKTLPASVQVAM